MRAHGGAIRLTQPGSRRKVSGDFDKLVAVSALRRSRDGGSPPPSPHLLNLGLGLLEMSEGNTWGRHI